MMDLSVEIDGDIGTLEEALGQFTAPETLDKDNKYNCSRFVNFLWIVKFISFILFFSCNVPMLLSITSIMHCFYCSYVMWYFPMGDTVFRK